ncbi:type VI secretion system contractile sheath large subunit [Ochrobactrum oryzae]|nr:type VI secretion system contractile sheath large subunit [Brucella oryzae]
MSPASSSNKPETPPLTADRVIVRLDQLINAQVNAIMQHPDFIAAECRWRGCFCWSMHCRKAIRSV